MVNSNFVDDRESFKQYCLRNCGKGAQQINVTDEQVEDRIDEALKYFYDYHYNATDVVYILWRLTNEDVAKGYIQLPPDIVAVTNISRPNSSFGIFSVDYQMQLQNLYTNATVTNYGDITYYFMNRAYISLVDWLFSPGRQYQYNQLTQRLYIAGGLADANNVDGAIMIQAYKKLQGTDKESEENGDSNGDALIANIWQERWLQDYVTALIQRQWGRNLTKYNGVVLMGGVSVNGADILRQALEDIKDLKKELTDTYENPIFFVVG